MTSVSSVTTALANLHLTPNGAPAPALPQAAHQPEVAPKVATKKSDFDESYLACQRLQAAEVLGPYLNVLDEKALGSLPKPTPESQDNQAEVLSRSLRFQFFPQNPALSYVLYSANLRFLKRCKGVREFAFSPIKAIRIPGGGGAQIIGQEWYRLGAATPAKIERFKAKLEGFENELKEIDASHIALDADDIDIHIDATGATQLVPQAPYHSMQMQLELIDDLIVSHYLKLQYSVRLKTGETFISANFSSFLSFLSKKGNSLTVDHVEIISPKIPWLRGRKISSEELQQIEKLLRVSHFSQSLHQKRFDRVNAIQMQIACSYIFRASYEAMVDFIIVQQNPFFQYHPLQDKELVDKSEVLSRDWHRLSCWDAKGQVQDFLIMRVTDPKIPLTRVAFQRTHVDILDVVAERSRDVKISSTWQAVFDKFFRLIRWESLEHADHSDWALFHFLTATRYRSVLPDTQEKLLKCFLAHCQKFTDYSQALVVVLSEKILKRSRIDATLNFAFIFSALSNLPEKEFSAEIIEKVWPRLQQFFFMPGRPIQEHWHVIAEALVAKKIDFKSVNGLLKMLAYSYLLLPEEEKAACNMSVKVTEHNCQKALQCLIGGFSFLFEFQLENDFNSFAESLAAKSPAELAVLQQIAVSLKIAPKFIPQTCSFLHTCRDELGIKKERLETIGGQLLKSSKKEVVGIGYQLLVLAFTLEPTSRSLFLLLRCAPDFFIHFSDEVVCDFLRKQKHLLTGVSIKAESALLEGLHCLMISPTTCKMHYIECLLGIENDEGNLAALVAVQEALATLSDEEKKKRGFAFAEAVRDRRPATALRVLKQITELGLGTVSEWVKVLKSTHEVVAKISDGVQFSNCFYTLLDCIRWCRKAFADEAKQVDSLLFSFALRHFEGKAIDRGIDVVFMGWNSTPESPLYKAAISCRSLQGQEQTAVASHFDLLIPTMVSPEARQQSLLAGHLFFELAGRYFEKWPEAKEPIENSLKRLLLGASSHADAKGFLQRGQKLTSSSMELWMQYCENVFTSQKPNDAVFVYEAGAEMDLWKGLCPHKHARFFVNLIQRLYEGDDGEAFCLADRLFSQGNGTISPLLDKKALVVAMKRERMKQLREQIAGTNQGNFSARIEGIVSIMEITAADERQLVQSMCQELIPKVVKRAKKRALDILEMEAIRTIYKASHAAFFLLCVKVSEVEAFLSFVKVHPVNSDDQLLKKALKDSFSTLLVEQMAHVIALLDALKSFDFSLWSLAMHQAVSSGTLEIKKQAFSSALVVLKRHDLLTTHDECLNWYHAEVPFLQLLCRLYVETKEKSYETQLEGAFEGLRKTHTFMFLRQAHFLAHFLESFEPQHEAPNAELCKQVVALRDSLETYLNEPEQQQIAAAVDLSYVKVMRYCNCPDQFLSCCIRLQALLCQKLPPKKITEEIVDVFYTVVCRAAQFQLERKEEIASSLLVTLQHYKQHCKRKKDPIMLVAALLGLSPTHFLQHTAEIALGRLKGEYLCAPVMPFAADWKPNQYYHSVLIERLLDRGDAASLGLVQQLMQFPQAFPFFLETAKNDQIATTIVHKLLVHPAFLPAAKKIVQFLNHMRANQFITRTKTGDPEFSEWVTKRKKEGNLHDFSLEKVFATFLTGYCAYLLPQHQPKRAGISKELEGYFRAVIVADLNKAGQDVSVLIQDSPYGTIAQLAKRMLKAKTEDKDVKKVLLCCSYVYLDLLLQSMKLEKEFLISSIEFFLLQDDFLDNDLAYFHNCLSRMLINEVGNVQLFSRFPAKLKVLIEKLLKRKDRYCKEKALLLIRLACIQANSGLDIHLQWHQNLVTSLKEKGEYELDDILMIPQLVEYTKLLYQQTEEKKVCNLAMQSSLDDLLSSMIKGAKAMRMHLLCSALTLLKASFRPTVEHGEYLASRITAWMECVKTLTLDEKEYLEIHTVISVVLFAQHRFTQTMPSYEILWLRTFLQWQSYLKAANTPVCDVLCNFVGQKAASLQCLFASTKEQLRGVQELARVVDQTTEEAVLQTVTTTAALVS